MSKKKLISKLSLSEEQIEEIKKKHSIDVVEELENILMEELKKIGGAISGLQKVMASLPDDISQIKLKVITT